jgi:hypothetical protein
MSSTIDLSKQVFEKQQYRQVVDTSFTELTIGGTTGTGSTTTPIPSIQEFFDTYGQLFYDIPKTGESNSHQYLVNQSSAYIGGEGLNEEVVALLAEVTSLREENLQLQQQLLDIQTPNG